MNILLSHILVIFNNVSFFVQNYKPPGAKDIPIDFRVELRKNAPNPFGVLHSKGETLVFTENGLDSYCTKELCSIEVFCAILSGEAPLQHYLK